MATYSPQVERWRPLVEKYFPPELVDKALYVINGESGGNPNAVGDGGAARGLFQIQDSRNFAGRPDAAYLDDPENNIRYAAQVLGAANNKWTDWGEGSTYNGQPFGALGNNPYPGGSNVSNYQTSPSGNTDPTYQQLQQAAQKAMQDWINAGSPPEFDENENTNPIYQRMVDSQTALASYQQSFGIDPRADGSQEATDAINRWATIEDVDIKRAQQAYDNWRSSRDAAMTSANNEITAAQGANADRVSLQEARNASSTPGLLPMNLDAGTVAPKYADALAKYMKKYGVTDTPPAPSGYVNPLPTETSTGSTSVDNGNPPPVSLETAVASVKDKQARDQAQLTGWQVLNGIGQGYSNLSPTTIGPPIDGYKPSEDDSGVVEAVLGGLGSSLGTIAGPVGSYVGSKAGKKVGRWFSKRFFAEGGTNIPGGPAVVGEKGPEVLFLPGFGMKVVGKNGPEQINIPEGASVIPLNEAYAYHRMQGAINGPPPAGPAEMDRANDPELQVKVMDSIKRAVSAAYAMKPPSTPIPYGGAPDLYGHWRGLSGVPYEPNAEQGGARNA